jgi:hypothetical protein
MITLRDSAVQSKISLLFQMERPYRITANDPGIMQLVDYDLSEAERQLEIWIFPTFFEDPEQKLQKESHHRKMKRFREGRWPEQRPYRRDHNGR